LWGEVERTEKAEGKIHIEEIGFLRSTIIRGKVIEIGKQSGGWLRRNINDLH
jgi:hypothetical protein